ncbi:MAG: hypothetical protein KAI17_20960, partial [Thiotrichaceae bacterium]|nr:hypothetical protein [Thiotrichaceae bacterium]
MEIEQEISSLAASDVSTADVITNKRTINTTVMVEDGQVLVLGGLIEDTYTDTVQKVPLLGDIPIIGKAFRNTKTTKNKQNLMVFIHPVIMRDVLSGDNYTRQKYKRLKSAQVETNIMKRGLLKERATQFPADIRRDLVQKMTPEQKKQLIIREQQERVLAYNRRIEQAKLAQQEKNRMLQQRRAAAQQAKKRPVVDTPIPSRLQNVILPKRN